MLNYYPSLASNPTGILGYQNFLMLYATNHMKIHIHTHTHTHIYMKLITELEELIIVKLFAVRESLLTLFYPKGKLLKKHVK